MADELTLPKLTRDDPIDSNDVVIKPFSRKRVRDSPPPDSSDPPIFSSDDDPSVEKYTFSQHRRKQRFRGPWFNQQPASDPLDENNYEQKIPVKQKRRFERQLDSGVFMGSDDTDLEGIAPADLQEDWSSHDKIIMPSPAQARMAFEIPKDIHAQNRIEKCLDTGEEYIDLSRLNLEHLSNSTIRPLANFVKVNRGYADFESLLKIILSCNALTRLPAELFNLKKLSSLSLRSNKLREIPQGIAKLKNLEDLNVSQNKLGYIPYDILDLFLRGGSLYNFQLHPNPFYLPETVPEKVAEDGVYEIGLQRQPRPFLDRPREITPNPLDTTPDSSNPDRSTDAVYHPISFEQGAFLSSSSKSDEKCNLSYQFRTAVRFLDTSGVRRKGPVFPSDPYWKHTGKAVTLPVAAVDDVPLPPWKECRVQSLLEIALKSCSRNPELPRLESYVEDHPPQLTSLLQKADNFNHSGPNICTVCSREFVIPRTEWIEWWEIVKVSLTERNQFGVRPTRASDAANPPERVENERDLVEKLVPLIRRGCSWQCIPGKKTRIEDVPLVMRGKKENEETANDTAMADVSG